MPYHDAVTTRISALVWQVLNLYIDQRHSQRYLYNFGHSSIFRMQFGRTLSWYNRNGMAAYLYVSVILFLASALEKAHF